MRISNRALIPAALLALLAPMTPLSVQAQNAKPNIRAVEVVVRDVDTKQDIATVQPGGTVTVPQGAHLRLIMSALPVGSARGPLYPATTFSDPTNGGVRITKVNAENSNADVQVMGKASGRKQAINYQIQDAWVPADLRSGTVYLQVAPAGTAVGGVGVGTGTTGTGTTGEARARELTRMIYQAILLREPDYPGAQGTVDSIASGGYDALVKAAVGIAQSQESRYRIPSQANDQQRLDSLYRNLLGVGADQVDRTQYDSDLRRLGQGQIADVVSDLVQSERFRTRANLGGVRY